MQCVEDSDICARSIQYIHSHLAYSNLRYRSIIQPNGTGNRKRAEEEQSSMNAWAGRGLWYVGL